MSSRTRILIVEDEHIVALDLRATLEDLGYDVIGTAASGVGAIRKAAAKRPDLVLMDIRLAGSMDGIATAAELRSQHDPAIVYLSANADAGTVQRALDTVPGGYLAKPYNAGSLRSTIEVALRNHHTDLALQRQRAELAQQNGELERRVSDLTEVADRLRRESAIDALTGLFNRREFDVSLKRELNLAERKSIPVGLILLDLDHFKGINDTFGHPAGDTVLQRLAEYLRAQLRPYDVPCRYGGEEIAILVPGSSLADTCALAERLRAGIESLVVVDDAGRQVTPITASFGISGFPAQREPAQLLRAADEALYGAKARGRNRVESQRPRA